MKPLGSAFALVAVILSPLLVTTSCIGRAPTLACSNDTDCAGGFACSQERGVCVLIAVNEGEGEGPGEGEGEGEGEAGEGEGEGEGEGGEGEGEGEGDGDAFTITLSRDPSTATVIAHDPLVVTWSANDASATCTLDAPDGTTSAVAAQGTQTFRPGVDGSVSVTCTSSSAETLTESTAFDVILPADVEAAWHAPFVATHPWRVDLTISTALRRRAFPIDVPLDLAALLRSAGVSEDIVATASPDSVRAVRVTPDGDLVEIDPYYAADTQLLFFRVPPLADAASVDVHVYFAPSGSAVWSDAAYANNHTGASAPVVLNANRDPGVALLDINGFNISPADNQDVVYERGARLVVGPESCTTPVHADDSPPVFPSLTSPPTLRVDNSEISIIEQRVQGVGGVDVIEVLSLAKAPPAAWKITTVLVNTTNVSLNDLRYSTLFDLDIPGVIDFSQTNNSANAIGAVPVLCDSSGQLCGALSGEASTGMRVGNGADVSNDFIADNFLGLTDDAQLADMRLAVTWLVPMLGANKHVVLRSALATNEVFDALTSESEAVTHAESLAVQPSIQVSPTWVRE